MTTTLIADLNQVLGFLKAAPISFDTEVVRDGKIVGYCFPIEYVNDLMGLQTQLKKLDSSKVEIEEEYAIAAIQQTLRRGYQQAVIDSKGIKLYLINEFQQRLMLEPIYQYAVTNGTKDAAEKFGITSEEVEAVVQFALRRVTDGAFLNQTQKKKPIPEKKKKLKEAIAND